MDATNSVVLLAASEGASMSIGFVFWLLFLVCLVFYGWRGYSTRGAYLADTFIWWILIFCLGVGIFGFPVHF